MSDDNLPAAPDDDNKDDRLPARAPQDNLPARPGGQAISVDLFEEKRGDDDEIDLLAYWRILVKRRWLVLGVLGGVVALSLLVTLMMPPVYRSTATLQIDRESVQAMQVEGFNNAEGAAPDFLTTQYELLKSRALAERVANELAIDDQTLERLASATSHIADEVFHTIPDDAGVRDYLDDRIDYRISRTRGVLDRHGVKAKNRPGPGRSS